MPCLGLMSNASSNPCPYCPLQHSKVGGKAKWEEDQVELHTLGSLNINYSGWFFDGQKEGSRYTHKWKSVNGPLLIEGLGDTMETIVLNKCTPGSLHLLLSVNDLINQMEVTCWKEVKDALYQLFRIKAHSYQGK